MNQTSLPRLRHDATSWQPGTKSARSCGERGIEAYASWESYQGFSRLMRGAAASSDTPCFDATNTLDETLIALLDLRASQINGCLLCVQHHLCRARKAGVPAAKTENIGAWRCAGVFSPCEKAVLSWAEHLAVMVRQSVPDAVWPSLQGYFSDMQIAALFMYWRCSELWSGDGVLRSCTASMPASMGRVLGSPV
ncbi:MAG TPA: carboxymuconolactone decarboxylase family protein [Paraburkholderia sp.]